MENGFSSVAGPLQQSPSAILDALFALQDTAYQTFQRKLTPVILPETVIGVRTPLLRKLAKELAGTPETKRQLREMRIRS